LVLVKNCAVHHSRTTLSVAYIANGMRVFLVWFQCTDGFLWNVTDDARLKPRQNIVGDGVVKVVDLFNLSREGIHRLYRGVVHLDEVSNGEKKHFVWYIIVYDGRGTRAVICRAFIGDIVSHAILIGENDCAEKGNV
jgi:hypothetical protein